MNDVTWGLRGAVQFGKLEIAREFIDTYGLAYSKAWENGYALLEVALKAGHADVAELLLTKGSKVNCEEEEDYFCFCSYDTPLHLAASKGMIKIVEMILNKNAQIDARDRDGRTPLAMAIRNKAVEAAELLVKYGANVNAIDHLGESPLHCAIESNHQELIIMLLTKGAAVNAQRKDGSTPLHLALEYVDKEIIITLLTKGAKVNATQKLGTTPLHLAAQKGYQKITTMLLEKGAYANARQNDGKMPLHLACQEGYQEIMIILLAKGTNVNVKDDSGITPLHLAVVKGDQKINTMLLAKGADVNAKSNDGVTPLHLAAHNGHHKITTMLMEKGADVKAKSNDSATPLHLAAHNGHHKITTMLLEKGADVHAEQDDGTTPLHLAVVKGDQEITSLLLAKGADANAKKNGLTPLHLALKHGGAETVVQLLLQYGAKVDVQDRNGKTVLYTAVETGYLTIVENILKCCPDINNPSNRSSIYAAILGNGDKHGEILDALLKYGFIVNPEDTISPELIHKAVEKGCMKVVEDFLKNGIDVNICDIFYGFTPLQIAVKNLKKELVELLISYDADINASNHNGRTALHLTALGSRRRSDANRNYDTIVEVEIAKLLLSKGANVDAKAKNGDTTLHDATGSGCASIVETLLEFNASVNAVNYFGLTPLHLAVEKGNQKIIIMLLEEGADVKAKLKDGTTPLHMAVVKDDLEIITMLLTKGADVNAKEIDGSTPLHLAVEHCKHPHDIVDTILKFGADINSTDNNTRTAFYFVFGHRGEKLIETFMEHGCNIDGVDCTSEVDETDEYDEFGGVTYYDGRAFRIRFVDLDGVDYTSAVDEIDEYDVYEEFGELTYYGGRANRISYVDLNGDNKNKVRMVQNHIVKMFAANLYVSKQQLSSVGDIIKHEMHDFYCECEEEIANMKSEKINNTNISFYDVLAKTTTSLANCMRNENIVLVFKSDCDTKFPIYGSMIKCNFRKSMGRKELLEQGNNIFHFFVNNFAELPLECTEKIFSYLSNQDIIILIQAFKPLSISGPNVDNEVISTNISPQ